MHVLNFFIPLLIANTQFFDFDFYKRDPYAIAESEDSVLQNNKPLKQFIKKEEAHPSQSTSMMARVYNSL